MHLQSRCLASRDALATQPEVNEGGQDVKIVRPLWSSLTLFWLGAVIDGASSGDGRRRREGVR